ncbi:MAG: hypothetical protein ABS70_03985 [Nitrospira sp. SCN 59-13]|nr:MAG: hypothetical protein ABS70_03985 [Nitrospira sp. SCN 59-13]
MMSKACQSLRLWKSWLVGLTSLLLVACTAISPMIPVGEGPLGTVALERLASRGTTAKYGSPQSAFQASHPASVSAAVISRLLSGLSVSGRDRPGAAPRQERYPLFTQEEVEFFSPLIAKALSQAGPDQRVRFSLHDDGLITQGTLYLHKTTLRVSLSHYRASQGQSDTRPAALTLSFTPSEALVRDDVPQSWMIVEPEQPRVAVSLDVLSQLPAAIPAPTANKSVADVTPVSPLQASEQPSVQQELQATKDVVVKQAQELQQLKAELDSLRRQLADKESVAPKTKPKPAPRKTAPTP